MTVRYERGRAKKRKVWRGSAWLRLDKPWSNSRKVPNDPGLPAAWESLYIAEGSDWYWWYGLDQDSGYDENWDVLFKVHLSNIYRAINLDLPPYLQDLWTNPAVADPAATSIVEPMIDGVALPGEWDGAARYDAPVSGGEFDIESFYFGYDASNVFFRVDATTADELESAEGDGEYGSLIWPSTSCNPTPSTSTRPRRISVPITAIRFSVSRPSTWWRLTLIRSVKTDERSGTCSAPKERLATRNAGCSRAVPILEDVLWTTFTNSQYRGRTSASHLAIRPAQSRHSWRDSLSYGDGVDAEMALRRPPKWCCPTLRNG